MFSYEFHIFVISQPHNGNTGYFTVTVILFLHITRSFYASVAAFDLDPAPAPRAPVVMLQEHLHAGGPGGREHQPPALPAVDLHRHPEEILELRLRLFHVILSFLKMLPCSVQATQSCTATVTRGGSRTRRKCTSGKSATGVHSCLS